MSANDRDPRRKLAGLPPGWGAVDGEAAANLEAELASELGPGHALEAPARALAQRFDDDSVLFALAGGQVACVRLTWDGTRASDSMSPATAIFESFDAWLAQKQDATDDPRTEFTDVLDLHAFAPRDAAALVRDFMDYWAMHATSEATPREVRIIHGKGIGAMRELVHAVLANHPGVERFGLATDRSAWGATVVLVRRGVSGPGSVG